MPSRRTRLSIDKRDELDALIHSRDAERSVVDRARMVLWWDDGMSADEIEYRLGISRRTSAKWRSRYADEGIAGLINKPRPLRAPAHGGGVRARILALTRSTPPEELGISHWSSREMARYFTREEGIAISHDFVADVWRENGLQPWRIGTFKLSNDPLFAEKVANIVGLYLNPPSGAVVLSLDEKTQVQALDRTQPLLPVDFDKAEKRTHDYVRHGITDLFAAMDVQTGRVTTACSPEHKTADFLRFMSKVVAEHRGKDIHVILDNASPHTSDETKKWLAKNPKVTFHFTPTGGSWINQIETWFGIITRQSIRRGTHKSVKQLVAAIERYVTDWNIDCQPFTWTATAEEILMKVRWVESEVRRMTTASEIDTITRH